MQEVEPTGQRGPRNTESGQNDLDLKNLRRRFLENEDRMIELWLLLIANRKS